MPLNILAIICARNEEAHIVAAIDAFVQQEIQVILVDHDSADRTRHLARRFLGHGLLSIEHMPWTGAFSLTEQLRVKQQLIQRSSADWVIHADADEWLQAPDGFATLRDGIAAAEQGDYNCVNFDEFVFAARDDENFEGQDCRALMRHYYFFEPRAPRLMRAWRRDAQLSNVNDAGHQLAGDGVRLYPRNFILRHYISLSWAHAQRKYLPRVFASDELARGWHNNRVNLDAEKMRLNASTRLKYLPQADSRHFERSTPESLHFWQW